MAVNRQLKFNNNLGEIPELEERIKKLKEELGDKKPEEKSK